MKTTSILDIASCLIDSLLQNVEHVNGVPMVNMQHINDELQELIKWVKEGKLEERIAK
jgi:hypothetical protein